MSSLGQRRLDQQAAYGGLVSRGPWSWRRMGFGVAPHGGRGDESTGSHEQGHWEAQPTVTGGREPQHEAGSRSQTRMLPRPAALGVMPYTPCPGTKGSRSLENCFRS